MLPKEMLDDIQEVLNCYDQDYGTDSAHTRLMEIQEILARRSNADQRWINDWWYIVAADHGGMTIDATGPDAEELTNKVASCQQEEDKWPQMGLVYMLVQGRELNEDDATQDQ